MVNEKAHPWARLRAKFAGIAAQPAVIASLPAAFWTLYSLGGETALATIAIATPILIVAIGKQAPSPDAATQPEQTPQTPIRRDNFDIVAGRFLTTTRIQAKSTALFMIGLETMDQIEKTSGSHGIQLVGETVEARLQTLLRDADVCHKMSATKFAICLAPLDHFDLELCIQFAGRIQATLEEPIPFADASLEITASVGFCEASRAPQTTFEGWQNAAEHALHAAQADGDASIRAFSTDMQAPKITEQRIQQEVAQALENGQIKAWFQPQLSTDTGQITGFEALARWEHPSLGIIAPGDFIPLLKTAGLEERLAEVMLCHTCEAIKAWDTMGESVPQVGINFSGAELSDPNIVEKVEWTLDRFEISAERLAVEVLEDVVSCGPDDLISQNVHRLSQLGCTIDLDDFGTGSTSITSLRRFAVSRIKIDRSFVLKSDQDPQQQRMVSAILSMAERLDLETVAEGVETAGEHALLAQLGCSHVQGFGIAQPMPFEQTCDWINAHNKKISGLPRIARNG